MVSCNFIICIITLNASSSVLGQSATFYGTLTTIIVLCVLMNQSNFIINLLEDVRSKVIDSIITRHNKGLEDGGEIDKAIANNKFLIEILKNSNDSQNRTDHQKENVSKCVQLFNELEQHKQNIGFKAASNRVLHDEYIKKKKNGDIDKTYLEYYLGEQVVARLSFMEKTEEQTSAPFYMLFFCIFVFIVNDIVIPFFHPLKQVSILFLYIFSAISICFWTAKWYFWCRRTREKCIPQATSMCEFSIIEKKTKFTKFWLTLLPIGGILLVYIILILCNASVVLFWLLLAAFIIVVAYLEGRIGFKVKYKNYDKMFIISHLLYIFTFSLIVSGLLYFIDTLATSDFIRRLNWTDYNGGMIFSNANILRGIILSFTVLNGFLLPFFLPYITYTNLLRKKGIPASQAQLDEEKKESQKKVNALNDAIEELKESTSVTSSTTAKANNTQKQSKRGRTKKGDD